MVGEGCLVTYSRAHHQRWWKDRLGRWVGVAGRMWPGRGSSSQWTFSPPPCGCSHRVLPPGEAESPSPESPAAG